ncbi:methylated-DNA--[protein]-cysteine S-methyltransferase [Thermovenabulum sp.]|uniref:methylated-DNA--[protein]-cysteine S-methyltransferase n=1 Tax=Thermovenabulum sp. TaxID=3100335 RepID=UPI003C7D376C
MKIYYDYFDSPVGQLTIFSSGEYIVKISFEGEDFDEGFFGKYFLSPSFINKDDGVIKRAKEELYLYFKKSLKKFDLPLLLLGTEFQKKVWEELLKIPYGELRSYKDIAENIGIPEGARAVGQANNKNPIPIVVPCHRVIGKRGELVGYGGGLNIKKYLIELEKGNP